MEIMSTNVMYIKYIKMKFKFVLTYFIMFLSFYFYGKFWSTDTKFDSDNQVVSNQELYN